MTLRCDLSALDELAAVVKAGGVVGYPTEAVMGLGCNPFDASAVARICALKERSPAQGFLLIASSFEQIADLVDMKRVSVEALRSVHSTWPGPHTWVFPRSPLAPAWLVGERDGIALRVTAHRPATRLCEAVNGPLVSTSANPHGRPPARTTSDLLTYFEDRVDAVLDEPVGERDRPSDIRDVRTGRTLRA